MPEKLTPRDIYLRNVEREHYDAAAVEHGAEFGMTGSQLLLFFTPKQIEHARQEMASAFEETKTEKTISQKPQQELPTTVRLPLKDADVEIPNQPLCTFEALLKSAAIIEKEYPKLIADLPEDEPWKYPKTAHAILTTSIGAKALAQIQQQLPEENFYLLLFIMGNHDLGRVMDAKKRRGLAMPADYNFTPNHGAASAQLLKNWNALSQFPQDTQTIISYALLHHADKHTPELTPNASYIEKIQYAFVCFVRDIDKLSLFVNKTDQYLSDKKTKAEQMQVNRLNGEQGTIEPLALLDTFTQYKSIDRTQCKSYEAFMLQFLAWIYDVNVKAVLEQIVQSGAVEQLLSYFKCHLPETQYQAILHATTQYLENQGLKKIA